MSQTNPEKIQEIVGRVVKQEVTRETKMLDGLPGLNSLALVTIMSEISPEGTLPLGELTPDDLETVGSFSDWVVKHGD